MVEVEEVGYGSARGLSRRQLVAYGSMASLAAVAFGLHPEIAHATEKLEPNLKDLTKSFPDASGARVGSRAASAAWGGYENGRIPASAMTPVPTITGDPYLRSDAAAAFFDLSDAFKAAFGTALPIREAYRSIERQELLWAAYQNGTGNLAAPPGTSVHGWALACDFAGGVASYGTPQKIWMNANAPSYGWQPRGDSFPAQQEPWHFEYDGTYNPTPVPSPTIGEDEEMYVLRNTTTGHVFITGRHYVRHLSSTADANLAASVVSSTDEIHQVTAQQLYTMFGVLGIPRAYTDPAKLPHGGAGGWWSLEDAILTQAGGASGV